MVAAVVSPPVAPRVTPSTATGTRGSRDAGFEMTVTGWGSDTTVPGALRTGRPATHRRFLTGETKADAWN